MRTMFIMTAVVMLAACSAEPRSASYFQTHRDEARTVLARCETGQHRGAECVNALAADAAVKADERMTKLKKGF